MSQPKIRRALISVYDKTGLVEFARALVDEFGIEIISTGGTATLLQENDIPVTLVEQVTGFPEMMDGRVKTLHPKIHAAILADRDNPEHMRQLAEQGIEPIDMVVVNLYPFEETVANPDCTFDQAIEMIDIGGPCLLRAAAKNHRHVLVVYDPEAYSDALFALRGVVEDGLGSWHETRTRLAAGAFEVTTCYDAEVSKWIGKHDELAGWPWMESIFSKNWGAVRYGENPHQEAHLLQSIDDTDGPDLTIADAGVGVGPIEQNRMSANNYSDASAAIELCGEISQHSAVFLREETEDTRTTATCVFIKHTNACGAGIGSDPVEAYQRAYLGDPNAAMGGILACDFEITPEFAEAVMDTYGRWGKDAGAGGFFVEVWLAPSFQNDQVVDLIRSRKKWGERVRLLDVGDMAAAPDPDEMEFKPIAGGMLAQTRDVIGLNEDQWKVVTNRQPSDQEMADLRLAWLICKHTKSNAITICKDGMLIGNGAGQMSRVMSCRIATWLANENGHTEKLKGSAAASDAFFPFRDGPELLIEAGVSAIIQPGGSKRDADTIAACDERGVAMVFTGTRHFKH
ncbi:MAG: bifunctional phosphoribosylaminoimidazolecarboxamide formyltransferase/IMP cyclohydrolase [bacterium]|nr:bifunctional phosphoribosylaminoimidazolecarboxamide formyltransferase/IMP cyclohydrolase [bacterium]